MQKVVIIGSGIVGSAIAFELSSNPNLDITLIDHKPPGSGATGAALGLLMGVISQKTNGRGWRLREASLQRYGTLLPELEEMTGVKIPYNQDGLVKLLFAGDDVAKWQKLAHTRASQGYRLEVWDQNQLKSHCPEVDVSQVIGAVFSPDDLQIHPPFLTQALVKGAGLRGVKCNFGLKVDNFVTRAVNGDNNKVCDKVLMGGVSLDADWLILTAGLGSAPLTSLLGVELPMSAVLGQALLVKHNQWHTAGDFNPVITGDDVHIVPMANHEFWLGATVEFPQNEVIPDQKLLDDLRRRALGFCPSLNTAPVMLSWTGKRPRPEGKGAPVIEKLSGYDNVILATGHYRNGILLAPATAQQVAQIINNE
ncbi:MAG: FAD-binding oxidoreductase [Cyanobacterium sp. T60_A2020_053]|nr:FAD-binding oxidoreductase [Cyanobacterium sp. T60_A2020_053]